MENRQKPPKDDYNRPLPKGKDLPPLVFFPEREWLKGRISSAEYEYAYFRGKMQYITKQGTGEEVLDEEGNPIPRRQFNITILMEDYNLPNGEPRKCWVKLGASMNQRANLPQFLINLGMDVEGQEDPTPQEIIDFLEDMDVKLQVATKHGENGDYQQVIWDSVKKQ